jgi:hypothetical protein
MEYASSVNGSIIARSSSSAFELGLELFGVAPMAQHEPVESERSKRVRVAWVDCQYPL